MPFAEETTTRIRNARWRSCLGGPARLCPPAALDRNGWRKTIWSHELDLARRASDGGVQSAEVRVSPAEVADLWSRRKGPSGHADAPAWFRITSK